MGGEFIKFYVCTFNKWNPYSEEVLRLPDFYWILSYAFIQMHKKESWDEMLKPQAELIGQITNPDVYRAYSDYMERERELKEKGSGESTTHTPDGRKVVSAATDSYYDPMKGLVDSTGRVIIPREKYEKLIGLGGVAISY